MIWRFVSAERANHRVSVLRRVLGVSRSGFYAWAGRPQYLAQRYEQRLRAHRIAASTGKVGCALDNALAESFLGTLKSELVNRRSWPTRREATAAIADYIAFHDHDRRHSRLGYHSPAMFETLTASRSAA